MTGRSSNPSLGDKVRETLERNGATEAEIDFLLGDDDHGPRRIELDALSSRQFIDLIERKLAERGISKVIPAGTELADAFRLFVRGETIERAFAATMASLEHAEIDVPADLDERVRAYLDEHLRVRRDGRAVPFPEEHATLGQAKLDAEAKSRALCLPIVKRKIPEQSFEAQIQDGVYLLTTTVTDNGVPI